jgi:PAS domain S-box-containing protein
MSPAELDQHLDDTFKVALFRALAQGVDAYVSCIDRRRRILFLNRTLSRSLSDILGKQMEEFIAQPQREPTIACVERAFRTGTAQRIEYIVTLAGGSRRFISTLVSPFRAPDGEQVALMLTEDTTERRHLAEQLEKSMEFRRRVIEHLPDFVSLVDRERRFLWVSRFTPGESEETVIGRPLDQFVSPDTLPRAKVAIEAAFQAGAIGQYEARALGDESPMTWFLVRVVPVLRDGTVDTVLLIASDVTERKRAERALRETEEQLHRAQRLESLGQLSGGIAHDFNNLLQVIDGNLTFAQERLKKGQPVTEELEQALRATERASELTSRLLAIGRRQHVDSKRVELGALVADSMRMLRRAIPENVRLDYQPPAIPCFVELDAPQFEQVLINLCVNARDAMPEGGTLTVQIERVERTHVVLRVRDTGTGIQPENLQRVFEPFFTTKGAGSGLGLAVAAGIIAAHGGVIIAESDGEHGATMTVRLPCVETCAEAVASQLEVAAVGEGVILVAEDEDMVRAQLVRVLLHAGYNVLEAENGARAVELFRTHQGKIDAVLLDMIMPELDGWQAFLRIEALQPGIPVLFSTGYAANVLPPDFAARGARLLSKPYKPQVLLAQIREVLDQARTSTLLG